MSRTHAHLTECVEDSADRTVEKDDRIHSMEKDDEDVVKSENVIKSIIGDVIKGDVKESDYTVREYRPRRCFKIMEDVVARKKPRKFITFRTMRNARDKSINHIMLDMIVIRMKLLNINLMIRGLQDKIKTKNESVKDDAKKPVVAMIKGNIRVKEPEQDNVEIVRELSLIHI